jgi:biopolymer transport protein ExbB
MHLTKTRNPAGNIIATIMRGQQNKQPQEMLREEVQRLASRVIAGLQSHLRIIEVIASLSPLLGLFGTVLGIIDAFHQLELAGNNVDVGQLSGGIWVALLTTAAGLAVGIPAVMAINWLEARVERFGRQTEDVVTLMFTYPLYANTEQTEEMTCSSARLASQGA